MKFLKDLLKENGDKLVMYNQAKEGKTYVSVFNYSSKYGGTHDSFKHYNYYVVELGEKNEKQRGGNYE